MKEENIDDRIERVIGGVASKKEKMDRWKRDYEEDEARRKRSRKRWIAYGIPAAASVVVICCIGLGLFLPKKETGNPNADPSVLNEYETSGIVYRGSDSEISRISLLIEEEKYEEALTAIDRAMADTVIESEITPERREYLSSLNAERQYELQWLRIQVLLNTRQIDEAHQLLLDYVSQEGSHREDAEDLLRSKK